MDESEENMSTEDVRSIDSPFSHKSKPKKRSLVERELETNLTARVTSPMTAEGSSTSRYGRARRLKTDNELESEKLMKPLRIDTKTQPQAYKMHASNSPIRKESPKRAVSVSSSIENQIENIYNENMSLSRFGSADEGKQQSPAKKFTKVYIRKDLIQKPDTDTVVLIKNMFSPVNKSSHLNNILERSSEKYSLNGHGIRNGFPDTSSVVKTLDFDGKKKKETKEKAVAKNELFELEASCDYQVGDLAWARVGTYPFWPCIVTREPFTDMFVKKKLFGRVEHDVIHVTFFGDNGRGGWIVDNMLRKFHGKLEFESARAKFTPEMKKKDPRLYAAHFVSEKKLPLWNLSVDEAETLMREPKRLRIDILYDMLEHARAAKTTPKRERGGKITRTDSDVSLSESLYDTLFSEDDAKTDDSKRAIKSRNKSLDVSEVVTACLDNMAAKTGIIKIQKQSHMDRWLQKAKSKTPEKTQPKVLVKVEREKRKDKTKKKQKEMRKSKNIFLSSEKTLLPYQNEHDYSSVNYENHDINDSSNINTDFEENGYDDTVDSNNIEVTATVESLSNNMEDCSQEDIITTIVSDDIVMNDLEHVNKVENCELVNDCPEITKESEPVREVSNLNNTVSLNETKQIESKVVSPENDILLTIGLQPRRSKRKSKQPDVEKNNSKIEQNHTEESKLEPVKTMERTDIESAVSDRNIINSNTDHRDNILDRDKKDAIEQKVDTVIKEDDPVVFGVSKDWSKQSKDNHSVMLSLNAPRPVVLIEPLKMEGLESRKIINAVKQKTESDLFKLNENVITSHDTIIKNTKVKDMGKNSESSVVNNIDSNFSDTNTNSSSTVGTVASKNFNAQESNSTTDTSVCENASSQEENSVTENIDKVNNQDEVSSEPSTILSDGTSLGNAASDIDPKVMDIDATNFHHTNAKILIENIESKSTCSEDSDLPLSDIRTNVMEPLKTDVDQLSSNGEKNDANQKLNVVIGEEMYIFERTLSQDYDEMDPDINMETDNFVTASSNEEEVNNDGKCEFNNASKPDKISPGHDDVDMEKDECVIEASVGKSENKVVQDDQVEHSFKIDTESIVNGVESDKQVFYKASVHKSKEKILLNGGNKLVSDSIIENTNKMLSKEDNVEISNIDHIQSEAKTKKKSPKLSLKKLVDQNSNAKSDTESLKSIFLENNIKKNEIVTNKDLKDKNEPCRDISKSNTCDVLDFEMLIDIERTKAHTPKINGFVENKEISLEKKPKEEFDADTASMKSEDSEVSITRRKIRSKEKQDVKKGMDDPEFLKYLEIRQDALIDEQPELTHDEIVTYLYQTWLYEESNKSDRKKTDDAEQSNLVKGLNQDPPPPKKIKKKPKVEKETASDIRDFMAKEKPKRKATQSKPYYNEEFSDLEEEDLETFSIFDKDVVAQNEDGEEIDEVELYFEKLTKPKPNVFKGYVREKVCEICDKTGNLVKCKSCHGSFHVDCVKKEEQVVEVPAPTRGRKKKKKPRGRKPKGYDESLLDSESQSDEKSQDANLSEEFNMSVEDEESHITVDAANFEAHVEIKMKELQAEQIDEFASDQEICWDAPPGHCEIIDIKQKEKPVDYSDFKCHNCEKYETPVCFVCKSNKSPKNLIESRQKCQVAHCHRYYHLECLEYWPQTQFNSWEPSKTNKKVIEYIEALSCPRHVCHTCVSDDPRGCKTRFCGDKLARCVKCPATYHSFTKCLPAGTQILTGSQIICPRHYEHRAGKVPCHVNTGWCFICALGGTLICCEYCPTSFHAECLNIKPPEGSYMCEDCETGRLPLYGEMVWVKLGHYRWWPGIVLHPSEIPENIMAVKHSPGEFVVRFFGQYDHYWVNRGRVFPFQEGDSGKISSQKSKIDAAFTTAMEHAQRACKILKNVEPNEEEDMDIASSLLPPHYVKLKANKPVGSLTARRDIDANSLTQCDCDPKQPDPCGPYSHCLNRMLLTECGPLCRAGERCNNRAFERRGYPRLAAYRTPQRGWGLKTLEDIRQGQFVIEYVGELIDEEEFRRRMRRKHEIRDENFYFLTLDKERMIDAGPKGNLARFMNHCCEPNCETQKWTVLGDVRVGLFALRDIPANSEVTFNYNLECAGIEKKRCLCGAKRCSGYIGAKPKQEEVQPKKVKVPGKRTYKKRKHLEDSPSTSKVKPPIKIKIKPIKPRELTEIEKDLLIIKNATNGMSSDSDSRVSSVDERKDTKAMKRKRVCFSTDEGTSVKKIKRDDSEVD